ncbi:transglutaminase family protein [Spongisporangium articulatum]|uniref:Transglutaminase family protein n=1 Tax=Spongisporangium articulatum TaxID=3362603 RepID=A0ABW8ANT1_9ACTN
MRIRLGYRIGYEFEQPTAMIATLNVHHSRVSDLERPDVMRTSPTVDYTSYRDGYGNWCNRLVAPAGAFAVTTDTVVRDPGTLDEVPETDYSLKVEYLPQEALVYLLASRFCESDLLSEAAWDLFGQLPRDWSMVQAISRFVHEHITFDHAAARPTMSAAEVFETRRGVCRDFAHLGVALCRAMNIPARYCTGYLGDIGVPDNPPMDFSGWFEVYLSGGWHTVDPRNFVPRTGRVLIARGRDAADVAITTTFGPNVMTHFEVWTDELPDPSASSGG